MEIEILSERENPLLNRKEIKFLIRYEGPTPTIKDIKLKIAAMYNVDKNLVIVDKIDQEFGIMESKCYVKIYSDENTMKIVEKKSTLEKNKIEEEKESEGENNG
ncbi:MAG TPA: 30S ribosomal protein S24e [Methanothermococcus okinawensis]|uniref:Small ribosomal subunit protein eS24 n=1 Tax=Methanofervidicoccus abyssi TaxID=2082189 RepID=A0A401HPM5_9EURY|nr:30S ribosomal protein S24e [Methanofervidicoccus abyssi]GBF36227.1 small subunit ribosomal protein S24e [Methanofervidicoccus abyssi]HIP15834.1 30S ribosomal protein S24e [Methanothermococcus okinawensis]